MKLVSIYEHMENGAAQVPQKENSKIIFRHSIRGEIKQGVGVEVELTNEGIKLAKSFGRGIDCDIGFVASSSCKRNIQTTKNVLLGKGVEKEIVVASKELEGPQTQDSKLSGKLFEELKYNNEEIIFCMNNEKLPGFNSIEESAKIMLDFIFANGNKANTVDLFCTHDLQMAILYAHLFGFGKTRESIAENKWPMMLEGMILWGERNHFWCSWREDVKEFCDC
ncbi:MAG: hypothetical protein IKI31_01165 [Treponema sp.]|nr:hypothetical protein [Treponema sp.]